MIAEKLIRILLFEDDRTQQTIIKDRLKKEDFPVRLRTERTYYNTEALIKSPFESLFDVIICDVMMPEISAYDKLKDLADTRKPIIFYTCVCEEEFCEQCKKILGTIPYNFKFIRKASEGNLSRLMNTIKEVA